MKKIIIFVFLFMPLTFAREEIPIFPMDSSISINYTEDNSSLINTDKMRRNKLIDEAKQEVSQNTKNRIQLDTKTIKYQRALDYITKPNNYLMPPVF